MRRKRDWLATRGIELVLADDWIAPEEPALYAACVLLPPAEQVAARLAALRRAPELARLDGVLLQSEAALPAGVLLAAERGLPGPSPAAVLRCLDKSATRAALRAADVPQPESIVARDSADVRRFGEAHGWPVIVKAFASTMARLVAKVDAPRDADGAVARLRDGLTRSRDVARLSDFARAARLDLAADPCAAFLCETFAPGAPFECDGFVAAGKARPFGVIEQVMTPPPRLYFEGYLLPADLEEPARDRVAATGARAAEALGLDAAGFSVELRFDGDVARVIEVNGRLGEDHGLWPLFARGAGRDPFELAVEIALGERPTWATASGAAGAPRHAVAFSCQYEERDVTAVPAAAEVAALLDGDRFLEAGCCVEPGDELHAPPHPETFPHLAWLLASDRASSRAAFAAARARVAKLAIGLAPRCYHRAP